MIKSITVHPKGATHFQDLSGSVYFLKQNEGVWMFTPRTTPPINAWIKDEILNDEFHISNPFCKTLLNKIGEVNVNTVSPVRIPAVVVHSDMEVIF